ncbi:hypothetical protein J2P12_06840 [Candidatus Bathyarchaeota archaeon]|nr:hypothetical protein [Candidatus Bathyarchaeota archaeon]
MFHQGGEGKLVKVRVGGFPNGLAFDPSTNHLLAANVTRQDDPVPVTVSMVDSDKKLLTADIIVPGRTRWTVFDEKSNRFYVNISKPSQIIAVESVDPDGIVARFDIRATGPHGLDLDREGSRLFCATDDAALFTIDIHSGKVVRSADLTGPPDVIFYNSQLRHLYVAVGDPGVIDVFDTVSMKRVETVKTERGAHTIGFAREQNKVYAFLPETHRTAIFVDK